MSVTNIENFTVTQADYQGVVGNTLYGYTGGTVELVLTPNQGYTLTATDFSWDGTPGNGVTAVNFAQDGTNVKCNLTIDPSYIIPAGGVSFPVCASGKSVLIPINLTLNFSNTLTNATSNVADATLAFSGDRGTTSSVLNVTLTADANNRFPSPVADSAFFTITNTNPNSSVNDSAFTVTKTYGQDNDNNFNSMQVVASYTYPTTDETFNFNVSGLAEAIPVADPLIISSISGTFSNVNWKGTSRGYGVFGTPGATFSYSLTAAGQTAQNGTGTINNLGFDSIPGLVFEQRAATGNRDFTLNITATGTTTLNATVFGGNTGAHDFIIEQTAQDTVFITRNVKVENSDNVGFRTSIPFWTYIRDGLKFSYINNAGTDDAAEVLESYAFNDTLDSTGQPVIITDTFEVPVSTAIDVSIIYTNSSTHSPGHYYLQSEVTGMSAGNGTINRTVPNQAFGNNDLTTTITSPSAGAAIAGVLDLRGKDTPF